MRKACKTLGPAAENRAKVHTVFYVAHVRALDEGTYYLRMVFIPHVAFSSYSFNPLSMFILCSNRLRTVCDGPVGDSGDV